MLGQSGWCPFVARLFDMVEERVGALPGVREVRVAAVWDTPCRGRARWPAGGR